MGSVRRRAIATGAHRHPKHRRVERRRAIGLATSVAVAAAALGVTSFVAPVEPAHAVTYDAQLVKDIFPGSSDFQGFPNSSNPSEFAVLGSRAVFAASSGSGYEPWVTDGTEEGTTLLKDINPGGDSEPDSSSPRGLTVLGSRVFFSADDGVNGNELWVTDGTAEGTMLFKDLNPGVFSPEFPFPYSSNPKNFTALGTTHLVFQAKDEAYGAEPWITDGTPEGTVLLKDIGTIENLDCCDAPSSYPASFTALGTTQLVFGADTGANGTELWITDGTEAGTVLLKVFDAMGCCETTQPSGFAALGTTQLVFSADDGTNGRELWITDGTAEGTTLLMDLFPGEFAPGSPFSGDPLELVSLGDKVLFRAFDGDNEFPWVTDGTPEGTVVLQFIAPRDNEYRFEFTRFGTNAIFAATDLDTADTERGSELWMSDGTPAGTVLLKDIYPGGQIRSGRFEYNSSNPGGFEVVGGNVFFRAKDGVNGTELWMTDGTEPGTTLIEDIYPGTDGARLNGSFPDRLTAFGDGLLFSADNELGTELWRLSVVDEPPTVMVEQAAGQADPALTTPINFTVTFSETVTGFDATDVNIATTAGPALTATVTGPGPAYNVAVSGMTVRTVVTVTVPAGGALDSASQPNAASTSIDNTVLFRRAQSLPGVITTSTNWGLRDILTAGPATTTFSLGARPLVPISGDWDGDGLNTAGYYKAGTFYLRNVNAGGAATETVVTFGDARGYPVPGDFNGDGYDDLAVYRNGIWQIRHLGPTPQPDFSIIFGAGAWPAIVPVAGDWDGDGKDGVGLHCLNASVCGTAGSWQLRHTASSAALMTTPDVAFIYNPGTSPYPVVGDWDANGTDTVGVKAGTSWHLRNTNAAGAADLRPFTYGATNDLPIIWANLPPEI